jgi:hypothetical protein
VKFIAGVDAHKDTYTIVFLDRFGRLVQTLTIAADQKGYAKALTAARKLRGDVVWGLESTGCYANAFARRLLERKPLSMKFPARSQNATGNAPVAPENPTHSTRRRLRKRCCVNHTACRGTKSRRA